MENCPDHILLCGRRRSGRSAMIRALLRETALPVSGFMTRTMNTRPDAYHEIYMFPYGEPDPQPSEACHIGDCDTRHRVVHTEVFNTLGVELIKGGTGLLVMDELGFMETDAGPFCAAVLEKLRGRGPVLAAVRTGIETPFLKRVMQCENALAVDMRPDDFERIYALLAPVVSAWGRRESQC